MTAKLRLSDLRSSMSPAMYAEVAYLLSEAAETCATVESVRVSRWGYTPEGRYFGALAKGEHMYRVETPYRTAYVRTRATPSEMRRLFAPAEPHTYEYAGASHVDAYGYED